jgi:hypothetical protein
VGRVLEWEAGRGEPGTSVGVARAEGPRDWRATALALSGDGLGLADGGRRLMCGYLDETSGPAGLAKRRERTVTRHAVKHPTAAFSRSHHGHPGGLSPPQAQVRRRPRNHVRCSPLFPGCSPPSTRPRPSSPTSAHSTPATGSSGIPSSASQAMAPPPAECPPAAPSPS